jgi:glycosidase
MKRTLLLLLANALCALASSPTVTKVEPPDWVVEPNGITLRVLITGTGLTGATVQAQFPTDRITISRSGTHLIFDLKVPSLAAPGKIPIHIKTAEGATEAPFSLVPTLQPEGRFQGFSPDDVIYLLMPDRFANGDPSNDDPAISRGLYDRTKSRYYHGGDFEGIIQHLPYLKSLGVTALWMTPIYDNSNQLNHREKYNNQAITDYHGYGAVDFYGVEEHFGTLDKFRELVDKAHALGIKIIQDEVANHTGPYHPWVKDPPTPTWFNGTGSHHLNETWRTWTLMDPHATAELQKSTLEGWFANILPDLNQNDPECAQYLIQNTLWWIGRTGLDGIREDTLPYVPRAFWKQWTAAIREHFPNVNVVGEVFDADPVLVSSFQAGTGVDALFDFPLHYAIRKFFTGKAPATDLSKVLAHDSLYRDANHLLTFVDLHDIQRFMSQPGATIAGLKNVFTFLLTARGIPMIYYGDEVGMQGGNDPDNRRDFPGGWKGDSTTPTPEQQSLVEHLQRIGRLRAELEPLRRGTMTELLVETDQYAYTRATPQATVLVVFNRAAEPATLHIPLQMPEGTELQDALGVAPGTKAQQGVIEVRMPPQSAAIYRTN